MWKQAVKRQCKVSSVKCKGTARLIGGQAKGKGIKVQELNPEQAKIMMDLQKKTIETMAANTGGMPVGNWVNVSPSGLEAFKCMPKEVLLQYKAMLDSGNSAVVEAILMSQGIKPEDFKAAMDELLK